MRLARFLVPALVALALIGGCARVGRADLYPALTGHDSHFLVIAHRGFSTVAPENTLPAMTAAARAGADMVEVDVQRTSDRQLVILHDSTLARTTDVAQVFPTRAHDPVGSFTLAQVQRLDAGSWRTWKGRTFPGTRVPTLGQLLDTLAPTHTGVMLELKNPHDYPGYETQVAQVLAQHHFAAHHRVYVHSFFPSALKAFHQVAPAIPLGTLVKNVPASLPRRSFVRTLDPQASAVDDVTMDEAQAQHLQVFAWLARGAPDTGAALERLADEGVTGIVSNRPDIARRELATWQTTSSQTTSGAPAF